MTLCLVTDRRRLGRSLGASPDVLVECLLTQIQGAVEAGIDLVQLRETDLEAAELLKLATRILTEVPKSRGRLVINDRLDVALSAGAAGVHLRERSMSVDAVLKLAPAGFRVGRSVHDVKGALAAGRADYLIAGTVLSTPSKSTVRLLGLEGLARIVRATDGQPVLGIGGLTGESVPALVAAGAAGLAAVGAFIPDAGQNLATFVQTTVKKLRFGFDSAKGLS
ncbi:MAG: thiamine phosphate synthase [Vicinamibacterales bacterium]